MSGKYRKLLVFWGVVLVLALAFTFVNWRVYQVGSWLPDGGAIIPPDDNEGIETGDGDEDLPTIVIPSDTERLINLVLSAATALAAAGGFLVTTYFAAREDRRESEMHDLEVDKLKREIQKKELEIQKLRNKSGGSA